jgi:hypothetical protein
MDAWGCSKVVNPQSGFAFCAGSSQPTWCGKHTPELGLQKKRQIITHFLLHHIFLKGYMVLTGNKTRILYKKGKPDGRQNHDLEWTEFEFPGYSRASHLWLNDA